jgi:hypothetical protein
MLSAPFNNYHTTQYLFSTQPAIGGSMRITTQQVNWLSYRVEFRFNNTVQNRAPTLSKV